MELRRYWSLLTRWFWLMALVTLTATAIAYAASSLTTPIYQASTTLLINQARSSSASPDYNSLLTSERLAKTYRELLRKRPVLDKVRDTLNLNFSDEQLTKNVSVDIVRDTQLIVLSVEDTNPQRAALLANEIAKEFNSQNQNLQTGRYSATKQSLEEELAKIQLDITRTQVALDAIKTTNTPEKLSEQNRLQTQLAGYRNSYANLLKSFEDVRLAEAETVSNLSVVEEAKVPQKPIRPNTLLNLLLGALAGFIFGLAIAVLLEYLDDSVKTNEQVNQLIGTPILGIVSRIKGNDNTDKLVTTRQASSPVAEAYRVLRANIEFSEIDNPIRTLVVTSSSAGEGKSTTTANLGVTMAQSGKRVILVDTDLRRPVLHKFFKQTNVRGVTSVLLGQGSRVEDHLVDTGIENLQLLASGPVPPNPAELLGSNRMAELIEQLKGLADIIIFDSSPVLPVVDPTLIARMCDATLLVVNCGGTRSVALRKSNAQLLQSGTRLLGVVMNRVTLSHSTYYNSSYYAALPSPDEKRKWHLPFQGGKNHSKSQGTVNPEVTPQSSAATVIDMSAQPGNYASAGYGVSNSNVTSTTFASAPTKQQVATIMDMPTSPQRLLGVLEIKDGPAAGQRFAVRTNRIVIGRGDANGGLNQHLNLNGGSAADEIVQGVEWFLINDTKVSRQHIEIVTTSAGTYLRDLGSLNGTWLNGRKLKNNPVRLPDNAELRLGFDTVMTYRQMKYIS